VRISRKTILQDRGFGALVNSPDVDQKILVRLLNSRTNDSVADSIRRLFENLQEVEKIARRVDFPVDVVAPVDGIPNLCKQGYSLAEAKRIDEIGRMFYRPRFTIQPYFDPDSGWEFYLDSRARISSKEYRLARLLAAIQSLGGAGFLSHVRKCPYCQRWFVASRKNQRFCKVPCWKKKYLKSARGLMLRRESMRRYRARAKRYEEKEMKRAQLQP
jgi:hypothetical protein